MSGPDPLQKMTEQIRAALDDEPRADFDRMLETFVSESDDLEKALEHPPTWLGVEDEALRAVITWIDAMSDLVYLGSRGKRAEPGETLPLAIAVGICLGYGMKRDA